MDESWRELEHDARELLERRGDVTPTELAEHLHIPEEAAASLLRVLRIDEQVRRYRSRFPLEERERGA